MCVRVSSTDWPKLTGHHSGQFTAVNTVGISAVPNVVNCESALFTVADECAPVG